MNAIEKIEGRDEVCFLKLFPDHNLPRGYGWGCDVQVEDSKLPESQVISESLTTSTFSKFIRESSNHKNIFNCLNKPIPQALLKGPRDRIVCCTSYLLGRPALESNLRHLGSVENEKNREMSRIFFKFS